MGAMLAGGLSKAGAMADKAMDAAGGALGAGIEAALVAAADAIQKGIDNLDNDFAAVGKEVAEKKADDIIKTYKDVINERPISSPQNLMSGCAQDAVSGYITDNAKADLVDKFLPVCQTAVQESAACKSWKKLIDAYNSANEQIGNMGDAGAKFKQEPITLDIERYIVEQIILGYRALMAKKEADNRATPASVTVPKNPTTFVLCWSGDGTQLTKSNYSDFKYHNK